MKKAIPYIIGVGELQRQASSVIKALDHKYEGFIVSHNEPRAVILSLKRYAEFKALEEAKRFEEDEVLSLIKTGDQEYERGETRKVKSLKDLL
ncbi:MAG: hypothetical protein HY073_04715 [Deltaproteobacteria bacterium]|nr:hypothetical protein [Deltaproteobacteria bacterium]